MTEVLEALRGVLGHALPAWQIGLALVVSLTAVPFDIKLRRIPNWLSLAGLAAGLSAQCVLGGWEGLRAAGTGLLMGFGVYFAMYLLRGMGAGDVKLMAALGATLGWRGWFILFLFTGVIAGVTGVALALSKGRLGQTFWNVGFLLRELASGRAPWLTKEQVDLHHGEALRNPHGVSIGLASLCLAWLNSGFGG